MSSTLSNDAAVAEYDAVVIGGGPAGAAIGRLLASWGHSVRILAKSTDPARGLAESLPPSSRKLFSALGLLELIDQAGFGLATGNTVWWGSREGRVEHFPAPDEAPGFQVFRPDLDRLLLAAARDAGAHVSANATVRHVGLDQSVTLVGYEDEGISTTTTCRFAENPCGLVS